MANGRLRLKSTRVFDGWLLDIKDTTTKGRFRRRIMRMKRGDFGDCRSVGGGVYELRFHFGPGWRFYYFQASPGLYWLLCGGTKDTQVEDVRLAKMLKKEVEGGHARI